MKGLSLTQPWAQLVAVGLKLMETRSWRTAYVGPIAIHAAKKFPRSAIDFSNEEFLVGWLPHELPLGAIVATALLVGCSPTEQTYPRPFELKVGNYAPGRFAWLLENVVALRAPVPCKGALGLWELSPVIEAAVRAAPKIPVEK